MFVASFNNFVKYQEPYKTQKSTNLKDKKGVHSNLPSA